MRYVKLIRRSIHCIRDVTLAIYCILVTMRPPSQLALQNISRLNAFMAPVICGRCVKSWCVGYGVCHPVHGWAGCSCDCRRAFKLFPLFWWCLLRPSSCLRRDVSLCSQKALPRMNNSFYLTVRRSAGQPCSESARVGIRYTIT